MYRRRITIVLTLMLMLTSSGNGQQGSFPFSLAHVAPGEIGPSYFEFSAANYSYRISSSARGVRKGNGDTPVHSFNLRLDRNYRLDHNIYHAEYQGDLLLAFNSFELPEVQGTLVIFRETPHYLRKKVAVIKVERASGKVISIDD